MTDNRRNIKVSQEAFDELKDDKPEQVNWSYYLTELRTTGGEQ